MTAARAARWATTRSSFDVLAARARELRLSFDEAELLRETHWNLGQDARLREDHRFRPTPWNRWVLSESFLANDAIVAQLLEATRPTLDLESMLEDLDAGVGRRCVICKADPRLVVDAGKVRLSAGQLTDQPLIEASVTALEQYATHLPVLSIEAAAASEPAGEWGGSAEPQHVEVKGWLRVEHLGRPLNRRMFVARVKGHSMAGGTRPIEDGNWLVFEFSFHEGTAYDLGGSHPTVLVRGDFSDPETGSYAVKRWDRALPEVRLVSSNADKERYPDIVVPLDEAEHLRIVATVAKVLAPSDFARKPRRPRKRGRRILDGERGLAETGERLERRIAGFFDGEPDAIDDPTGEAETMGWQTRLVCLAHDAGGLHLEVGPLDGLPSFVKKLRAVGANWVSVLLAGNARLRPDRLPVRPGSGPWTWQAVGFESEAEDLGLARLDAAPVPAGAVSVFRVDATGVGHLQAGTSLSLGQLYHLLVPPGLGKEQHGEDLGAGWRLWTLDLAVAPAPATRSLLAELGLLLNEAAPRLEWALSPPAAWRCTPRGGSYPVFSAGESVTIQALGLPMEVEPVTLFLRGPSGTERLVLPLTPSALVSLGRPVVGRWALALLHPRTEIHPAGVLFEVVTNAVQHVDASWSVRIGAEAFTAGASPEHDLSRVEEPGSGATGDAEGENTVEVAGPPGWPVTLAFRLHHDVSIATLNAGAAGSVDLSGVLPLVADRARRTRVGELVVDLDELGRLEIAHLRGVQIKDVAQSVRQRWVAGEAVVRGQSGRWIQLLVHWFRPLLEPLGYELVPFAEGDLPDATDGLAAWRLAVDERSTGGIERHVARVLILTTRMAAVVEEHRGWLDRACDAAHVRDAIVTDGIVWSMYRRGSRSMKSTWDLSVAVGGDELETMLSAIAEGL